LKRVELLLPTSEEEKQLVRSALILKVQGAKSGFDNKLDDNKFLPENIDLILVRLLSSG
jgi:hypothetical protein